VVGYAKYVYLYTYSNYNFELILRQKWRYCNECKNKRLLWDLYAGIAMNIKNQHLLWDLYAGIIMNIKNQHLLWDLYVGIAYLKIALWSLK